MRPEHFTELLRLCRVIGQHHDRMVSPPRSCGSVLLWENMHALEIARAADVLRFHLVTVLRDAAQMDAAFALLSDPATKTFPQSAETGAHAGGASRPLLQQSQPKE